MGAGRCRIDDVVAFLACLHCVVVDRKPFLIVRRAWVFLLL